jgi:uncharacterized protein YndB with AHSA1/START domain
MPTTASVAAPSSDRELVVSRMFDAPRRQVFAAWTDPDQAAYWWGPRGFVSISCAMEVRPGGSWRRVMRSPAGSLHVARGVYREIVPPERLVFTFAWEDAEGRTRPETLVTVTLAECANKTLLVLRQALFETVAACDAHADGWTSCLERFAAYLASVQQEDTDAAPGRIA